MTAVERGLDEERHCPHCETRGAIRRGRTRGLRRYQRKGCGRTFNAVTGTPLSGLHEKDRWLAFGGGVGEGGDGQGLGRALRGRSPIIPLLAAFRWRHRLLNAVETAPEKLKGIVEADETYVLESRKGQRRLARKARKRGGKATKRGLSGEQVPVLVAVDRSGATISSVLPAVTAKALAAALEPVLAPDMLLVSDGSTCYPPCAQALKVSHQALNLSAGERVRGELHSRTVNNRQARSKDFLRRRRGIASKYLTSYLRWFHMVILNPGATPRTCLAAAIPSLRFAN